MPGLAVFAYGSLVARRSAGCTLGREVSDIVPVELTGWRRRWSLCRDNLNSEKKFARADGGPLPRYLLGLNLEPAPGQTDGPNGALIQLSDAEVARLDVRELRYDRVDVTSAIESDFDRVITYTAKPEHFAPTPPENTIILARYAEVVGKGFAALGSNAAARFLETTGAPPVEVVKGVLVEDDIPPGNPREW